MPVFDHNRKRVAAHHVFFSNGSAGDQELIPQDFEALRHVA